MIAQTNSAVADLNLMARARRSGSGLLTVTCNAGDWVLTGWTQGSNIVGIASMGPQNARRQWTADIILAHEAMIGSIAATCYDES